MLANRSSLSLAATAWQQPGTQWVMRNHCASVLRASWFCNAICATRLNEGGPPGPTTASTATAIGLQHSFNQ